MLSRSHMARQTHVAQASQVASGWFSSRTNRAHFCLQMDTVSSGLAADPNLQMLALCCNTRSVKAWAKDSLAVRSFPSIMALPRHEPNVYRLTERGRTESGVVVFLNTVFQREGDAVLALSAPAQGLPVAASATAATASTPPRGEPSIECSPGHMQTIICRLR